MTEDTMGAQKLNFVLKFLQYGFLVQTFYFRKVFGQAVFWQAKI